MKTTQRTSVSRTGAPTAIRNSQFAIFDLKFLLLLALLAFSGSALAAVRYVDANSATPAPPFASWATAATNIQDAVDAADIGDEVVVTNGIYAHGGRTTGPFLLTNRVVVDKPLTVRSVNGPAVTIIEGYQVPGTTNGDAAIRCVYLINGATLMGFTLTNGATRTSGSGAGNQSGGGVNCAASTGVIVSNCVITGNASASDGGGAYQGSLIRCVLTGNRTLGSSGGAANGRLTNCVLVANRAANYGGGAGGGTLVGCLLTDNAAGLGGGGANSAFLYNCTLVGNTAGAGGGSRGGTLLNCLLYFNSASARPNYDGGSLSHCCTTPLPSTGSNNLALDPQLASIGYPSATSPCRGAGNAAFAFGTDLDGEPWLNPPSIGCDEYHAGVVWGSLRVSVTAAPTTVAVGFPISFTGTVEGRATASRWEFGGGLVTSNQLWTSHAWTSPGDYPVVLRAYNDGNASPASATTLVHVVSPPVHHVAAGSASSVPPFTNWATAATIIQEAVDAATVHGAVVLVSNGVYATGGRVVYGTLTNRVAVTKPVQLRSVNGPQATVIQGAFALGTNWGDGAVRCVYLVNGASLSGFTLTSGATRTDGDTREQYGGGVWCEAADTPISNCVFAGNAAFRHGGGVCRGTLTDCVLSNNVADLGGGVVSATLERCTLRNNWADFGGGAFMSTLNACTVAGNSAFGGGGTDSSTLNNCLLTGNTASEGGGTWGSTMTNCTLAGNTATDVGGGVFHGTLANCILYFNTAATSGDNYAERNVLNYCCTTPLPTNGVGNLTNAPLFVDYPGGDLRLQAGSPGINAGANDSAAGPTDLDGKPRIFGGTVDMGAYEWSSVAPLLRITRSDPVVFLSWPNTDPDWKLVFTTNLVAVGTNTWSLIPPPYPTNLTDCVVTESVSPGHKFYRLRKP
ncbi:MAG: PKD domain-containing protein [Verrucomicrobia bacterium]|nr:PKD domain-containing protein [Verrucomicrobiota bacterium]